MCGGGGGPWGFGKILLKEVLESVRKSRGAPFSYFIAFLCDNFADITPPPEPLCTSTDIAGVVSVEFEKYRNFSMLIKSHERQTSE